MAYYFNGAEDGSTSEWSLNGDSDGQNYHFTAIDTDPWRASYAYEQYLEGSGGAADWSEFDSAGGDVSAGGYLFRFSHKLYHSVDNNTDFDSEAEVRLHVTLTDGTSEVISYRVATDSSSPSSDASNLFYVVGSHNNTAWSVVERDINSDLSNGGYSDAETVDQIELYIHTPGSGGGSDEIGLRYDNIQVTDSALDRPSQLSSTLASSNTVDLEWADNSGADEDGFRIYRGESAGSLSEIDTVGADTTTYSDSGLEDGEEYFYAVSAYNASTESTLSGEVSETTDLPAAVLDDINETASDELTVEWTRNDSSSEGTWEVYRSTDGSLGTQVFSTSDLTTTSYADSGLNEDTDYHYTVRRDTGDATSDSNQEYGALLIAPTGLSTLATNDTITVGWSDNTSVEDGFRVYISGDGGSTYSNDSGDLAPDTTSYEAQGLLDGKEYTFKVEVFSGLTAIESGFTSEVTDLPDEDQPVLGNGVEDEIAVDRESVVTDNGSVRIQTRQTGESSWDSTAAGWDEQVLAYDTLQTTVTDRLDGEEYEVRARTETTDVTGNWTTPVSIITDFPGAQNLSLTTVSPTQIDGSFEDVSDNEDGFEIWVAEELDPLWDTGFADAERVETLGPNETTFSLTGLNSNHAYQVFIRAFTEHTSADTQTAEATTEIDYPSEGWFVVLEDDAGDKATIPEDVIGSSRPKLQSEMSAVGRWFIDIVPSDVLRQWLRSEAYIYFNGDLWMRGPFTRYHPNGGSGDAAAKLEGLGIFDHLKAGGKAFEVTSEPGYKALDRFITDELPDWVGAVTPPANDTIDENWSVQEASTEAEFEDVFGTPAATDPWELVGGDVHPLKGALHVDARSTDGSYSQTDAAVGGSDDYVDGFAAYLDSGSANISTSITLPYTIPEEYAGLGVRQGADDSPAVEWRINDTVVDSVSEGVGLTFDWDDNAAGAFDGTGYANGDLSGTVDIDIVVTSHSSGQALAVDWIVLYDKRYYDVNNFPNSTDSDDQLPGPHEYPVITLTGAEFSQEYNITRAQLDTTIDDVSGDQRLQATNTGGSDWLPNDGTEQNTQSITAEFADAELYGTAVQGRVTLGAYGTRTGDTPTEGFNPQTLSSWEVIIDTSALRVIDDQVYTGSPFEILDSIADDSGMAFVPEYLEDELRINAFAPGDEVLDLRDSWTVVDDDPVDTTEGYFNKVTVFGPEQDDGTRLSVQATSKAEIERLGEVEGPALTRPDAETEDELRSIARTELSKGISNDTITGTLEIVSQFVQPGYAYKVDQFAELSDKDDPAYVLKDSTFEWGTMTLDFEGRNSLARAIRSIETDVRVTKRAL